MALEAYETAITAIEQFRTWAIDDEKRQEILENNIDMYNNALHCYINLKQYEKAILLTERARSRHLVDLMATADLYDNATLPPELGNYLQQYEDLQEQINRLREPPQSTDTLRGKLIHSETAQTLRMAKTQDEKVQDLQDRKMDLWQQIRRLDPVLAGEKEVAPINWDALTELIADLPNTALVSFYSTNEHTYVLILRKPSDRSSQEGKHICTLHTCTDQGYETLQTWIYEQWLDPYQEALDNKKLFLEWQNNMEARLQKLADRLDLSTLIDQHLQGIEELIIIPHIFLHLIPFAALPIHKTHEQEARYLGDRFRLRILPSANILKYCHDRQNSPTAPIVSFNAYGSVEGAGDPSKDYAMTIARTLFDPVAQGLEIPGNQRLLDLQATSDRYHDLIKSEQVQAIHSIHHASAQLDDPLNSALHLADGDITLAQLMSYRWRMPQMQDIFLAACETNLGNPSISDDILTLGAGFLCAGARSVVSTLWSVDAIATTVFCEFYYYERQLGHDRPTALHNAQVQLRDQTITELNRSLAVQAYLKLLRQEILGIEKTIAPLEAQEKDLYEDFKSRSKPRPTQHPYRDLSDLRTQLSQKQKDLEKWKSGSDRPFESPYFWSAFILQGLR